MTSGPHVSSETNTFAPYGLPVHPSGGLHRCSRPRHIWNVVKTRAACSSGYLPTGLVAAVTIVDVKPGRVELAQDDLHLRNESRWPGPAPVPADQPQVQSATRLTSSPIPVVNWTGSFIAQYPGIGRTPISGPPTRSAPTTPAMMLSIGNRYHWSSCSVRDRRVSSVGARPARQLLLGGGRAYSLRPNRGGISPATGRRKGPRF